jgi:lysophospholipase L1-like esterase
MRALLRVLAVLLLVAFALPAASPAAKKRFYVSLGDSLGAGYQKAADGTVVFHPGYTGVVLRAAKKTTKRLKLRNFSCPGEDVMTFAVGGCKDTERASSPSQLARAAKFMRAHKGQIALVTVSLGANEFTPCTSEQFGVDLTCVGKGKGIIDEFLPERFEAIRKAAGKRTPIAALTLYNPYVAYYLDPVQYNLAPLSDGLAGGVNDTIAKAAKAQRFKVADGFAAFDSGNFSEMGEFNGQQVPVAVANACKFTQQCLLPPQKNIHPTDLGYKTLGNAFISALGL